MKLDAGQVWRDLLALGEAGELTLETVITPAGRRWVVTLRHGGRGGETGVVLVSDARPERAVAEARSLALRGCASGFNCFP